MDAPFLVFPHQLFKSALSTPKDAVFYLIEDERFFRNRSVPKDRLLYYRASMQAFRERLLIRGNTVHYLDSLEYPSLKQVVAQLQKDGVETVRWHALGYPELEDQLLTTCEQIGIDWHVLPSPTVSVFLPDMQAKRLKLSLLPTSWLPEPNRYIDEATEYVEKNFSSFKGSISDFAYPVTYDDAQDWLEDFLLHRLSFFSQYGGTIFRESALPLLLGSGLLLPHQVEKTARELADEHRISTQALKALLRLISN